MTDDLHDLAAAYVLDALEDGERAAFEAHLGGCAACRAEIIELRATTERLADTVATMPPPSVREAVLSRVPTTPQESPPERSDSPGSGTTSIATRRSRRRLPLLAAAAAVVLVLAGTLVVVTTRGGDTYDDVVTAPDAISRTLDGAPGTVVVTWSPERGQVAVSAEGVIVPPPGFVLELWAIVGASPVPAGLFEPRDGSLREIANVGDLDPRAWGITIEPDGGSDEPTGEILYFVDL